MRSACLLLTWMVCLWVGRAEYALHDGDTVVFLGDSITAARQYSKVVETYTLLRFPERKVRFVNSGKGGETVKGSLDRLEDAVFKQGATLLTVAYGVNDIGWGAKADEAHKQEYLTALSTLIDRCQQQNVRVFICSAASTAEAPDSAEKGFLQRMCDEGLALAKSKGAGTIDVQRSMRTVQRRLLAANAKEPERAKHVRMHAEDGIHLNELGQMAMAFAILKGLGAPAEVSSASLDASHGMVIAASGCRLTKVRRADGELSFTRMDDRLPLNLAPLWMLHGFYIPIGEELNEYRLTVKALPPGRYRVFAGGRPLGDWPATDLDRGVNLASATANPWEPGGLWDAQGQTVKTLTDVRDELVRAREAMAGFMTAHPKLPGLEGKIDRIGRAVVDLQREMAKPVPVGFVVRTIAE